MILRELRKWRPILKIAVQSPGADCAALELFAAGELIGEPMESIRGVRGELLQRCHLSYFRRDSNQTAPVKNEVFNMFELADGLRKLGNLRPLARSHLRSGGKFLSSVARRLINELVEALPSGARSILLLCMDLKLGPGRLLVLGSEAATIWSRDGVSRRLTRPEIVE